MNSTEGKSTEEQWNSPKRFVTIGTTETRNGPAAEVVLVADLLHLVDLEVVHEDALHLALDLDDDPHQPNPMPALTVIVHDQIVAAALDLDPAEKIDALIGLSMVSGVPLLTHLCPDFTQPETLYIALTILESILPKFPKKKYFPRKSVETGWDCVRDFLPV